MFSLLTNPVPLPDALSSPIELAPFAQVELVVLDLDGTLLGHSQDLPGIEAWKHRHHLVNRLRFRGVPLTLATGRAFAGAKLAIEAVSRQADTPFILYNGSVVLTAGGTVVTHNAIDSATVQQVQFIVEADPRCCALLYGIEVDHTGSLRCERADFVGSGKPPEFEFNGIRVSRRQGASTSAACVAALLWSDDPAAMASVQEQLQLIPAVSVTGSGSKYLELRPRGSSKGSGLRALLQQLRIDSDRVLAVGDNDNDVELLRAVGVSVCVSNASEMARRSSMYKSKYESSMGAIEVLELVTRARRLFPRRAN